jgi:hypothetical protein
MFVRLKRLHQCILPVRVYYCFNLEKLDHVSESAQHAATTTTLRFSAASQAERKTALATSLSIIKHARYGIVIGSLVWRFDYKVGSLQIDFVKTKMKGFFLLPGHLEGVLDNRDALIWLWGDKKLKQD